MVDIRERVDWRDQTERQIAIEDYKLNAQEGMERLKYQVEYSQAALRNLQLVNGGAMIALLTFIGNVDGAIHTNSVFWSFVWFSIGLTTSLTSYLGAYFSQSSFMNVAFSQAWEAQHRAKGSATTYPFDKHMKRGNIALAIAIGLAIASMACFVIGAFVAIEGLKP